MAEDPNEAVRLITNAHAMLRDTSVSIAEWHKRTQEWCEAAEAYLPDLRSPDES